MKKYLVIAAMLAPLGALNLQPAWGAGNPYQYHSVVIDGVSVYNDHGVCQGRVSKDDDTGYVSVGDCLVQYAHAADMILEACPVGSVCRFRAYITAHDKVLATVGKVERQ